MALLAGLLINCWGLTGYSAIRLAIIGAFLNPRELSGRSKSLTSKLQSDFACLIMNKCLAIMLTPPFIYLSSTYSNRRTENPKNRLVNLFFTNATANLAPLQYL